MVAKLLEGLVAPLRGRAAAGAFATIATAVILTAVVFQPSHWTVEDQPRPAAGPERVAATSPEASVAVPVESPAAEVGTAGRLETPMEASPPPPVIAAEASEKHVAVAPTQDAAAARPPPAPSAPAPARKQRAAEPEAASGGRSEAASARAVRGRLDQPMKPDPPGAFPPAKPSIALATPGQQSAFLAPRQQDSSETGLKALELKALEEAARSGNAEALWRLGRIYADGEGVPQNHLRAFEYFRALTEIPAASDVEDAGKAKARFVAEGFIAVGRYYLTGIDNSDITPDPARARNMFSYAATFFADPVAQYELGRMYLDGVGGAKDLKLAARWLYQSAVKGDYHARAAFGSLLLKGGPGVPRDGAMGLTWLKLAAEAAPAGQIWIAELYNNAAKKASRQEREAAEAYVKQLRESGEK
jgi:TPR repeat protein